MSDHKAAWAMRVRRAALRALLAGALLTGAGAALAAPSSPVDFDEQLHASLPAALKSLSKAAVSHGAQQALQQVYADSGAAALWTHDGQATPQARALIGELAVADSYGLQPRDYAASELAQALAAVDADHDDPAPRLVQFDLTLSVAALRLLSDLHFGRVSPESAGFQLQDVRPPFDLVQALKGLAAAPDVSGALAAAEPEFVHYKLLKVALAQYRHLAQEPALPPLPAVTKPLKVGDSYAGAAALRQWLERFGDLVPSGPATPGDLTYDAGLSAGVARFQDRNGLTADGALGKSTLTALQVPLAQRIRQISLTLERWRWLPPFKTPPIIVNIPQFQLFAFRTTEDRVADILQMEVIVGRTYAHTQTPVFQGNMQYVVLRPYWDVPMSIVRNEMLPKIHANPRYLASQHLELVNGPSDSSPVVPPTPENIEALAAGRLRIRQQPGEDNALGLAKFIFPNSYNVYLHSTPAHQLFSETVRAFSHGCIRVADPLALATLVLKDANGDWTREKIAAAMDSGPGSVRVPLRQPINVLIVYATALATEAGPVLFFNDLYGYDRKLEQQLGLAPAR